MPWGSGLEFTSPLDICFEAPNDKNGITINMLVLPILFFYFFIVFIVISVSYKTPNVITKGMKPLPCRSYDK